ncbi:hypothetical protein V3F56_06790 [Moorellaceae bacterium AZ2]
MALPREPRILDYHRARPTNRITAGSQLPVLKAREVTAALRKIGFEVDHVI